MTPSKQQQRGATFLTWIATVSLIVFIAITAIKLVPIYLEFSAVKTMTQEVAQDSSIKDTQQLRRKLAGPLNVNGFSNVLDKHFSLVLLREQNNVPAIQVDYEVRKQWFANIEFLVSFHHAEVLKR